MKILSITTDQELSELRKYALEAAGHDVVALINEKDGLAAAQDPASDFDVVLVCHHVLSGTARQLIRLLRQYHPEMRIIYMVRLYGEWPDVEADRYVVGADGPAALIRVISEARTAA
jgi:DNA-binding response OmpR family regulator